MTTPDAAGQSSRAMNAALSARLGALQPWVGTGSGPWGYTAGTGVLVYLPGFLSGSGGLHDGIGASEWPISVGMDPVLNLLGYGFDRFHLPYDADITSVNMTTLTLLEHAVSAALAASFCAEE